MEKIVRIYKSAGERLKRNTSQLRKAGKDRKKLEALLTEMVQKFVDENEEKDWYFRLHYSGDFYSKEYAQAWAKVIRKFPKVKFWAYTRSFQFVKYLIREKNLSIYLSTDSENWKVAVPLYKQFRRWYKNIGIAWLGHTMLPPKQLRFAKCPETFGKLSNHPAQGACSRCRICCEPRGDQPLRNVVFKYH